MNEAALVALSIVIFGWAVLSEWFAARNLTGPLVFLVAGLFLANPSWGIASIDIESSTVHVLAEITLALLLFADASAVPWAAARQDRPLTARLLAVGPPLSIVAGTALAVVLFPSLPLALAGLIAASLAPTDAALSAAVIADERLPIGVRRVLNVESGLNDGIATPVVTFCIASAATALGVVAHDVEGGQRRDHALLALGTAGAPAAGHAVGWPSSATSPAHRRVPSAPGG
jgi:sodium/hydrogen antiporter